MKKSKSGTNGDMRRAIWLVTIVVGVLLVGTCPTISLEVQDAERALELQKKAQDGDREAQFNLALLYWYNGHDQKERKFQDAAFQKCAKWAKDAARLGSANAQALLANLHDNGLGMDTNKIAAFDLYRSAALQGHTVAQFELAKKYETGEGVATNLLDGYTWYHLASSNRDLVALAELRIKEIEAQVLEQFRAEAKRRKTDFMNGVGKERERSTRKRENR